MNAEPVRDLAAILTVRGSGPGARPMTDRQVALLAAAIVLVAFIIAGWADTSAGL